MLSAWEMREVWGNVPGASAVDVISGKRLLLGDRANDFSRFYGWNELSRILWHSASLLISCSLIFSILFQFIKKWFCIDNQCVFVARSYANNFIGNGANRLGVKSWKDGLLARPAHPVTDRRVHPLHGKFIRAVKMWLAAPCDWGGPSTPSLKCNVNWP